MAMDRDDSDDFVRNFLVNNNLVFLNQDVQDGVPIFTTGTTDDLSNQGEAYDLKFGPPLRNQDRFLPMAKIARLMKKSLPVGGMQTKEARECVQECVSEFISFITSEASDICSRDNRTIIDGDDIICAMGNLGFNNYVEPMRLYLQKYREAKRKLKLIKTKDLSDGTSSNDKNHQSVFKQESLSDSDSMI